MSFRVSVPAIFCVVSFFGISSALHAQTAGADRIYAAEAKAAALRAQNEQLKQSIATQSAALKRLDDEINLMRQDHELQLKNVRGNRDAEIQALRSSSSAQITSLREANVSLSEQVQRLREQSMQRAKNEASLDSQARSAQVEAARLEATLNEQSAQLAAMKKQIAELQASNAAQKSLAAEAPELRQNFAMAVKDNKALRQQLARSEAERVQLKEAGAQTQTVAAENERFRAQLDFLQERNATLQESLSVAPTTEQLSAVQAALNGARQQLAQAQQERKTLTVELANQQAIASNVQPKLEAENNALRSSLKQANAQLQQGEQSRKALQLQLAQLQAQASSVSPKLEAEHQALQTEYNQLLDGIRGCETRLDKAQQAASVAQAAALPSSQPEDIRRISELESALDRANTEIRNANRAFEEEIKLERAMAAGSEVELEQQYQKRIQAMQDALQSCRAS